MMTKTNVQRQNERKQRLNVIAQALGFFAKPSRRQGQIKSDMGAMMTELMAMTEGKEFTSITISAGKIEVR